MSPFFVDYYSMIQNNNIKRHDFISGKPQDRWCGVINLDYQSLYPEITRSVENMVRFYEDYIK
jgi:DNA polymerase elongation subunit (family B)